MRKDSRAHGFLCTEVKSESLMERRPSRRVAGRSDELERVTDWAEDFGEEEDVVVRTSNLWPFGEFDEEEDPGFGSGGAIGGR